MARASKPRKQHGGGPYLDAALICEDCIQEKDWVISPIRAVNRLTAHDLRLAVGQLVSLPLVLVLSFKAGNVTDTRELFLYVVSPSGDRQAFPGFQWPHPIAFQGRDTGQIAVIPIMLPYEADGTYWIEVVLGRKEYSRVPLTFQTEPATK
jgi:hypothetical protein